MKYISCEICIDIVGIDFEFSQISEKCSFWVLCQGTGFGTTKYTFIVNSNKFLNFQGDRLKIFCDMWSTNKQTEHDFKAWCIHQAWKFLECCHFMYVAVAVAIFYFRRFFSLWKFTCTVQWTLYVLSRPNISTNYGKILIKCNVRVNIPRTHIMWYYFV